MILSQMREQAQIAIDTADVIVFLVDVRQGLVDADSKVADMLRPLPEAGGAWPSIRWTALPEIRMTDVYEFYNLGIGDPIPVFAASSRLGIGELLDELSPPILISTVLEEEEDERPRVAIVGKPNVGKSSIVNRLLGERTASSSPPWPERPAMPSTRNITPQRHGIRVHRHGRTPPEK